MIRRPPRSTRTDTLFPYTTLFRSHPGVIIAPAITLDHNQMLPVDRTDRARDALEQRRQRGIALLLAAMPAALAVEIPIGLVEDVVAPDPRFVGVARG